MARRQCWGCAYDSCREPLRGRAWKQLDWETDALCRVSSLQLTWSSQPSHAVGTVGTCCHPESVREADRTVSRVLRHPETSSRGLTGDSAVFVLWLRAARWDGSGARLVGALLQVRQGRALLLSILRLSGGSLGQPGCGSPDHLLPRAPPSAAFLASPEARASLRVRAGLGSLGFCLAGLGSGPRVAFPGARL